jgi:hypothetical protein
LVARGRFLRLCCSPKRNPHLLCSFHRTQQTSCACNTRQKPAAAKRMKWLSPSILVVGAKRNVVSPLWS